MKKVVVLIVILCSFCCHIDGMTNSKLSIHTSMGPLSSSIVAQGKPRLIKLLDNFVQAAQIKSTVPGIVIVGRIYLQNQPTNGDPTATAQQWWNSVASTINQYSSVDYWEGYNEVDVGTVASMQWYSSFEEARVKILQQNGKKAAIGSFSAGVPDVTNPSIIQALYPAVDAAIASGGILGLHEYSSPYMNGTYSGNTQTGSGWLTGRYRKLYQSFLLPTGRKIPLVISENGIDGGTCSITGCSIFLPSISYLVFRKVRN